MLHHFHLAHRLFAARLGGDGGGARAYCGEHAVLVHRDGGGLAAGPGHLLDGGVGRLDGGGELVVGFPLFQGDGGAIEFDRVDLYFFDRHLAPGGGARDQVGGPHIGGARLQGGEQPVGVHRNHALALLHGPPNDGFALGVLDPGGELAGSSVVDGYGAGQNGHLGGGFRGQGEGKDHLGLRRKRP